MWRNWSELPEWMQIPEVREYYEILSKRKKSLIVKRVFDLVISFILLIIAAAPMIVIAAAIAIDSPGGIFYRQERVTAYGKRFMIHKFRTMVVNADTIGTQVTARNDSRVTKIGKFLRKYRLDELPQLIDILIGDMSFVGTRPEVVKYVKAYTKEMRATLLLPAGVTSEASIRYKDEADLLSGAEDVDRIYIEKVLPGKMEYNLESIRRFGLFRELKTMIRTVIAVA
ncbi:MAG: sugar transferase [Dorea sp.]|uniref:sugar transferase n=1 Tax=Sporofaciens sp. JLR.KK001 TaxID=3112621 RepID=UPI002171DA71|nr:sugar transferase [Dorea sp.]